MKIFLAGQHFLQLEQKDWTWTWNIGSGGKLAPDISVTFEEFEISFCDQGSVASEATEAASYYDGFLRQDSTFQLELVSKLVK